MSVHIYTSNHQAATHFVTDLGSFTGSKYKPDLHWTRLKPRAQVRTSCCRKRRWAKHCTVQVYYDMLPFWCKPGKGCKVARD